MYQKEKTQLDEILSPISDHILKTNEKLLENADVMKDFPVNNYIGAKSLEYNLSLIPDGYDLKINKLRKTDKKYIFYGLEKVLSEKHIDKIWEMIWNRWCYFEQVRNKEK